MARPLTPLTAFRQVLLLRADALGLTPNSLTWRIRHWGLERACTTPRQKDDGEPRMAQAIESYYATHPGETPPWEREATR